MRVIVAGDAGSIFVRQYIEHVLLPAGIMPVLATDTAQAGTYLAEYQRLGVALVDTSATGSAFLPHPLRHLWGCHRALKRYVRAHGKSDVLHFHGLFRGTAALFMGAHRCANRIVLTYWGSDLLRAPDTGFFARRMLRAAHAVSVSSDPMEQRFLQVFEGQYREKLRRATFGVPGFEAIDRIQSAETPESCKAHFGFPPDKLVVVVGYNASPQQQHILALDALEQLPESVKRRLFVVLPLTYGTQDAGYLQQLAERLQALSIPHQALSSFLSEDDLARFRLATDIFLHAQTTDAFSATIQEHLYTERTLVFSPDWIPYPRLDALGVVYFRYDCFETLPGLLEEAIAHPPNLAGNRDKLYSISSFEVTRPGWLSLYR